MSFSGFEPKVVTVEPFRFDLVARWARPAVLRLLSQWRVGRLELRLPEGEWLRFGSAGAEPVARVHVRQDAAFRRVLFGGEIGAGESYTDGDWWAEDLPLFLELCLDNLPRPRLNGGLAAFRGLRSALRQRFRANTRRGSRRNIRDHYDLGNEFYRLFLDESLTYSSAVYPPGVDDLAEAQAHKLDGILDRLGAGPGDRILEIGCGWGSFALRAAERRGCRVTGLTLSERQQELARERVAAAGLSDRIEIRLLDYRDINETFDHVVSIEMFEAVGFEYYDTFFAAIDRALRPGGRALIQTITVPDEGFTEYRLKSDWIRRHVFPGSLLASVGEIRRSLARVTKLALRETREIGPDYARTLRDWRVRFHERLREVHALGYDERFIRLWDYYLASCEAGFARGVIGNSQLLLGRSGEEAR